MKVKEDKTLKLNHAYLIKIEEVTYDEFRLKYELYCTFNERKSYDLKVTKYNKQKLVEESKVIDFEWREKEAQNIFSIITKGKVTPLCLEDCVLELI
jgi:hypothetical protein